MAQYVYARAGNPSVASTARANDGCRIGALNRIDKAVKTNNERAENPCSRRDLSDCVRPIEDMPGERGRPQNDIYMREYT